MHISLTDHRCLTLIVPRPLFAERMKGAGAIGGRVFPAGTPEAKLLGGMLRHLFEVAPVLSKALAEAAGLAALDLLAACLAPRAGGRQPRRRKAKDPAAEMGRVERFVRANLARPRLGIPMLCRHLRCSRSTLYALLQPRGGVATVVRRLEEARRLLGTDEGQALSVEALARRCGFGNAQALRRALKDAGEASPRDLRVAGDASDGPPPVNPESATWVDAV